MVMDGYNNLNNLLQALKDISAEMESQWMKLKPELGDLSPVHQRSAENLIHYVTLRRHDVRHLQEALARNGYSSLGRAESHVMASLQAVLSLLQLTYKDRSGPGFVQGHSAISFDRGRTLLKQRTDRLLGAKPENRDVRIMVTMPSEAAVDYDLVKDLLTRGMDCMRINCAHDNTETWAKMIDNLKRAQAEVGRFCRICMDVAGPKLRTGAIEDGPQVLRWRPARDLYGKVLKPAQIWLTSEDSPQLAPKEADASLPLPPGFLAKLKSGDRLYFIDTRGAKRALKIIAPHNRNWWAESSKTSYVNTGTTLTLMRIETSGSTPVAEARIGWLPPRPQFLLLKRGSRLLMTREPIAGKPAIVDEQGREIEPARISCTIPEVFNDVREGDSIWFDDGKIGGVIIKALPDILDVEITNAKPAGEKLRADKGINFPDSQLTLPSLTDKDLEDLKFIVRNADLVGYSFIRTASDVEELQRHLGELGGTKLGIILKIETRSAFEHLPDILLASMKSPAVGVMIARGDLAVESGFERMAEVQEEIMWLCEAAHLPVIWATQVLEKLSTEGRPSRAEITDAAMSERAECVMLNKGPFVVEAVRTLDRILTRMQDHQEKKTAMLRRLKLAAEFLRRH